MHIIAGTYKNRQIITRGHGLKHYLFRPTTSKVRAAVFNILENSPHFPENIIHNSNILDIYCGSGSFGLESLSRGASSAAFIDNNRNHLDIVRFNVEKLKIEQNVAYMCLDARNLPCAKQQYNIVYIDPPYNNNDASLTINSLLKNDWLMHNSIIIIEISHKQTLSLPEQILPLDERLYGSTKILLSIVNF